MMMPLSFSLGLGLTRGRGAAAAAFSPADLNPDLWLEMDGTGTLRGDPSGAAYTGDLSDEAAIAAAMDAGDDEFCSEWASISPATIDMPQSTTTLQPGWLAAAEQAFSLPALDFVSANNQRLIPGVAMDFSAGGGVAVVFEADNVTDAGFIFASGAAASRLSFGVVSGELRTTFHDDTNFIGARSGSVSIATKYVAQYLFDGVAGELRINGVQQAGINTIGTAANDRTTIGIRNDNSIATSFDGRIAAVLAKTGARWSDGQRQQLDTYLANKYGVSL